MAATTENKPLYAIAGAADAAVAILRTLPNRLVDAASDTSIRDQVRAKVSELPEDAKNWRAETTDLVEKLPARAHEFPGRLSEFLANVSHDAGRTYNDLAMRGEGVVAKLRDEYGPKVDDVVGTVRTRVTKASEDVEGAVSSLRAKATDVVDDVTGNIVEAAKPAEDADRPTTAATRAATKPAVRKVPTADAPVTKATTTTAPAKKTTAKSTPAKKATPAKKSTAKTTATKKSATKKAMTTKATPKSDGA